jgi:tRNA (cytosine49-C5)-methyltransferase
MKLSDKFIKRYSSLVDDEKNFIASLSEPPQKSFRINKLKHKTNEVIDRLKSNGFKINPVSWCDEAFSTDSDKLSFTLEKFIGSIYIQELASMLPPLIVRKGLECTKNVLDACAAPGSKTTQIADYMNNKGCLIANDKSYTRIRALKYNLNKAGVINTIITNFELHKFPEMKFDFVFLDAPCSADGTIRKSPDIMRRWSINRIKGYSERQKDLILRAYDLLAENGTLVYSTCSMAPEENEAVVDWLLNNRQANLVNIRLDNFIFGDTVLNWGDKTYSSEISKAVRIWPHHNNTDGFFIAQVSK